MLTDADKTNKIITDLVKWFSIPSNSRFNKCMEEKAEEVWKELLGKSPDDIKIFLDKWIDTNNIADRLQPNTLFPFIYDKVERLMRQQGIDDKGRDKVKLKEILGYIFYHMFIFPKLRGRSRGSQIPDQNNQVRQDRSRSRDNHENELKSAAAYDPFDIDDIRISVSDTSTPLDDQYTFTAFDPNADLYGDKPSGGKIKLSRSSVKRGHKKRSIKRKGHRTKKGVTRKNSKKNRRIRKSIKH